MFLGTTLMYFRRIFRFIKDFLPFFITVIVECFGFDLGLVYYFSPYYIDLREKLMQQWIRIFILPNSYKIYTV